MTTLAPGQNDVVVDDGNDAIFYSSNQWRTLTNATIYHGGTEHISYDVSATAVLSFTGTYVWFFPDLNSDHGRLSVSIDNGSPTTYSTFSQTYKPATQALFGQALDAGSHILTITNLDKGTGIDYFAFRPLSSGAPGVDVAATDSQVGYSGDGQWKLGRASYQITYSGGASVSFTFEGSSISYISDKNNDHGRFEVSLDGGSGSVFSSYSPTYQNAQVLFTAPVAPGRHTITITNLDANKALGVDHFSFVPLPSSSSPPPPPPSSPPPLPSSQSSGSSIIASPTVVTTTLPLSSTDLSDHPPSSPTSSGIADSGPPGQTSLPPQPVVTSQLSVGIIVGIVLASLAILLFGILFIIIFRRRSRRMPEARPQSEIAQPWVYSHPVSGQQAYAGPPVPTALPSYTESESQASQARGSDVPPVQIVVPYRVSRTKS